MSFDPFNPFTQPPRRPQNSRPGTAQGRPQQPSPKDLKAQKKEQRSKVMRYMFNPELGSSLEGIKETHGHFMRLIANIFLQTGLIDAAYPGLRDPKQLKLLTLIETAYRGLEYTREGMPRVLLFAAFVGSLAAVVLAVLIFAVSIMSSSPTPPKAR